jgi:hypothetical protein
VAVSQRCDLPLTSKSPAVVRDFEHHGVNSGRSAESRCEHGSDDRRSADRHAGFDPLLTGDASAPLEPTTRGTRTRASAGRSCRAHGADGERCRKSQGRTRGIVGVERRRFSAGVDSRRGANCGGSALTAVALGERSSADPVDLPARANGPTPTRPTAAGHALTPTGSVTNPAESGTLSRRSQQRGRVKRTL